MLIGGVLAGLIGLSSGVAATRATSPSYIIDASVMDNFGGTQGSGSYRLVSGGGESIIGSGTGGSYKLAAGYVAQLGASPSSIKITTQPAGLVAYYPLNETAGTAVRDYSSNSYDGLAANGASWAPGQVGGAINLNPASGQQVEIPDQDDFSEHQQMTVSLWAFQSAAEVERTLISHWDYSVGEGSWALMTANDNPAKLRFLVANGPDDGGGNFVATLPGAWPAGQWNHVAVVYDGSLPEGNRVKIYVNGEDSTAAGTAGTISPSLRSANAPLTLGVFYGRAFNWNGSLDHVKIFSRALSEHEVKAEYGAQAAGLETGLTLGRVVPGTSNVSEFDIITETSAGGYNLAISQNHDLQKGADSVPGVGGSIDLPAVWQEGATTGLGFSLTSTNATAIPGKWSGGDAYASIPSSETTFYSRSGRPAGKDVLRLNLRLGAPASQAPGDYSQTTMIIGTTTL